MDIFPAYFSMGLDHISDIKGYDHMLFIIILCSIYRIEEWRKVAILITAFTLGHSTTLALSALKLIITNPKLIEVIIPVTILITCISNLFYKPLENKHNINYNYLLALVFGFVHGMGFSNFFNALMGDSMNILYPLFAFNLGLEAGQLLIVAAFFLLYYLLHKLYNFEQKNWILFISGAGAGISILMIFERLI